MKPWKKLSSKYLLKNSVLAVRSDKCLMGSGKIADPYFVVEKHDFVMIAAFTKDKKLIMVRQYRHPVGKIDLEFPAGFIKKGEKPEKAAHRELKEETGYKVKKLKKIGKLFASPGVLSNNAHFFVGFDAEKVTKQHLDKHEEIEIELLMLKKTVSYLKKGKIKDIGTAFVIQSLNA